MSDEGAPAEGGDRRGNGRRASAPAAGSLPPLRLDLVQAFVAVAEELHFTRAADRLHLSQPGLSRRIRTIEGLLGAPLVTRSTRVVALTPAGSALLPHAQAMLEDAEAAVGAVAEAGPT